MQLTNRLNAITGKSFLYNTNQIKVQNWTLNGSKYSIHTDKRVFDLPADKAGEFLDSLQPVSNEPEHGQLTVIGKHAQSNMEDIAKLKGVLFSNIEKLQADKEYIPQAAEINNQAKSYIDLVKSQVEILKLFKQ